MPMQWVLVQAMVPDSGTSNPPGIWGGGNVPMPTPPIHIPQPPLGIWGGGNVPMPNPPIHIPPFPPDYKPEHPIYYPPVPTHPIFYPIYPEHPIELPPGDIFPPLPCDSGVGGKGLLLIDVIGAGYRWLSVDWEVNYPPKSK